MQKKPAATNPYADAEGAPLEGKEQEFYSWATDNAYRELKELPSNQQQATLESERALNKRMRS